MHKEYAGIDYLKFILSLVVIAIHTRPLTGMEQQSFYSVYSTLCHCAVPIFFSLSGFLLVKDNGGLQTERISKSIIRFIRLYVTWTIIYLPLTIYGYRKMNPFNAILRVVISFLVKGDNYNSYPLWYLLASIYGMGIIYVLKKIRHKSSILMLPFAYLLFIIGTVITYIFNQETNAKQSYFLLNIYSNTFGDSGRLFTGMLYILIGILVSEREKVVGHFNNRVKLLSIMFLIILLLGQVMLINYGDILMPLIVCCVTLISVSYIEETSNNSCHTRLRNMSTVIYFIHMYIYTFVKAITYHTSYGNVRIFFVTLFASVAISFLLTGERCRNLRFMSKIFGI